jgi:hypothetical protein
MDPLEHVAALELRLLEPGARADPEEVESLLHPEFREIGASGRMWDREAIVRALAAEPALSVRVSRLQARPVRDDVVHITYLATPAGGAPSWRSSLWTRVNGSWKLLFHQGTPTRRRQ